MLDKLTQLHKSKFVKCFLIALVLVFSYEVSKPKALVPLAWAGAVLAGMAAEQMITMGVKAASKAALKRKADSYAAEALRTGKFDFMGTNPYRNKDGSITLSPTANDRAKMAGLISGALIGGGIGNEASKDGMSACLPESDTSYQAKVQRDISNTAAYYAESVLHANKANVYFDFNRKVAFDGSITLETTSAFTGALVATNTLTQYKTSPITVDSGSAYSPQEKFTIMWYAGSVNYANQSIPEWKVLESVPQSFRTGVELIKAEGGEMVLCDEVVYPSTLEKVYPAPMNMSSTQLMPNNDELKDKPFIIMNVMPPSETEGPITWNEIENNYTDNPQKFAQVMDSNIDTYLEKGDLNSNVYTIGEINNYYTDVNYSIKKPDFVPELESDLPVVTDPVDPPAVPKEDVDNLDHSMWQVMKNTYNYLDDGIDSSLAAMKGITDSASGITNYLGQTMGWLPAEWRAVFTSAFVLGVFAHFLRR